MSPEHRLLNEVERMDQAMVLHERLQYVSQLKLQAQSKMERDLAMECLDEMLDFTNAHSLGQVLGEIALIKVNEENL